MQRWYTLNHFDCCGVVVLCFPTPTSTWCSDVKTISIHEDMENVHLSYWLIFYEKRKCNCRCITLLASFDILIENIEKLLITLSMLFFEESVSLVVVFRSIIYYIKIPSFAFFMFVDSPRKFLLWFKIWKYPPRFFSLYLL